MRYERYRDTVGFAAETLEILLEDEVQNNLPISFAMDESADAKDWFLASVKDEDGGIALTAVWTGLPYRIVMYETRNAANDAAVQLLSNELKSLGLPLPGVMAEQSLARRFAEAYAGAGGFQHQMSINIMRLDKVADFPRAPGHSRLLREEDLYFIPYWERIFQEECHIEVFDIPGNVKRVIDHLGKDIHYIWEDGCPVSQNYNERCTPNGAAISGVYTPPQYRGKGYASSVVADLSQTLLDRGYKFCYLFADASNPVSCGIYRNIGYYDYCCYDGFAFN